MKDCGTPKVVEIKCPGEVTLFHKVLVPAEMGDETTNPPKQGAYKNTLLVYEATGAAFMYSSDGIYTFLAERGPAGPEGPAGPAGPQGERGEPGPQGERGETGPAGPQGERGEAGPAGPKGDTGDTGPAGPKGDTGDTGPAGPVGPTGPAGADGFSPSASVTQTSTGATITITDAQGTTTADVHNGQDAPTYTAGANIQINNGVISATDTTYSDFTGTDGTTAGANGLVPAPATTDFGKFLSASGSWDSVPASVSVISTPSYNPSTASTTDAMSQLGVYLSTHGSSNSNLGISIPINGSAFPLVGPTGIAIGSLRAGTANSNSGSIAIGYNSQCSSAYGTALGTNAQASNLATALGYYAEAKSSNSVAVGRGAIATSTSGSDGIAIGSNATLQYSASGNVTIGADSQIFKGFKCVALGAGSYVDVSSQSDPHYNTRVVSVGDQRQNGVGKRAIINVADGVTATDAATVGQLPTTMTGATSSTAGTSGLVPAPAAGDQDKYLKGDGTWATVQGGNSGVTTFYPQYNLEDYSVGDNIPIYVDAQHTTLATEQDFETALENGDVRFFSDSRNGGGGTMYQLTHAWTDDTSSPAALDTSYWYFVSLSTAYDSNIYELQYFGNGQWKLGAVRAIQPKLTAGTNITINGNTISATDTTYSDFTGATASVAGAHGLVPAPAAGDESKALLGNGTWGDATAKLVEMSYGESNAWAKFIAAYNAGSIVYCRASSNANPGTGSQTRKAFMAYVNNATNPTNVEFQYVRSQSSKTDSQQCDQVFVYTLTNASGGTWSVASRNMAPKINVDGPITKTFSNGANATVTIGASTMTGATSSAAGATGVVPAPAAGDHNKVLTGAGTWEAPTVWFYLDADPTNTAVSSVNLYSDSSLQTATDLGEISSAFSKGGGVIVSYRVINGQARNQKSLRIVSVEQDFDGNQTMTITLIAESTSGGATIAFQGVVNATNATITHPGGGGGGNTEEFIVTDMVQQFYQQAYNQLHPAVQSIYRSLNFPSSFAVLSGDGSEFAPVSAIRDAFAAGKDVKLKVVAMNYGGMETHPGSELVNASILSADAYSTTNYQMLIAFSQENFGSGLIAGSANQRATDPNTGVQYAAYRGTQP